MQASRYYQRVQIQFMTQLGMRGSAMHRFLLRVHGNSALSQGTVYCWMHNFRNGRGDCCDTLRSGCLTKLTPQTLGQIRLLLNGDCTLTVQRLSTLTNLGFGTVQKALRKCLDLKKQPARWVPHDLTNVQKQRRVNICDQLLRMRTRNRDLTNQIITGDESWMLSYDPATKQSTASWLRKSQQRPAKPRVNLRVVRLMLVCFFDAHGIVHREFIPQGLGVGANVYLGIMQHLRRSICRRRPQMWLNNQCFLQHNRAPAHRANLVIQYLCCNHTQVLPHPAYSLDVAPADYWLFARIKKHLKGRRFQDVNELCTQIDTVMNNIAPVEFQHTMSSLIPRWRKVFAAAGEYFE